VIVLCVVMLGVVMLSVIKMSAIMLGVVMLSVIMLGVVILNVIILLDRVCRTLHIWQIHCCTKFVCFFAIFYTTKHTYEGAMPHGCNGAFPGRRVGCRCWQVQLHLDKQ
jgi:hypothetical protein